MKLKSGIFLFIMILQISALKCHAAELSGYNSSGIVNRSISVDPTGRSEGFSAVIYNNTNGLPTSEANAIAETSEALSGSEATPGLSATTEIPLSVHRPLKMRVISDV